MRAADSQMVVLSGRRSLQISTDGSLDPVAAWHLLRENRSPRDIAHCLKCGEGVIKEFIHQIELAGLLMPPPKGDEKQESRELARDFSVRLIQDSATMWKRHSLMHPIFRLLGDEVDRPALALGLLVEICHYAYQFPVIISQAAAQVNDSAVARMLADFAAEEKPHYEAMANALSAHLGVSAESIVNSSSSSPLKLLLAFLDQGARRGPATLAAALFFVEMSDAPAEPSADAFMALAAANGLPRELFVPFANHAREDEALDHGDVATKILEAGLEVTLSPAILDAILNFVHDVKHGFDLLYDGLVDAWADPGSTYALRKPVRWKLL